MTTAQTQAMTPVGRRGLLKAGGAMGAAAALSALMGNTAHAAQGRRLGDDTMQAPDNGGYGAEFLSRLPSVAAFVASDRARNITAGTPAAFAARAPPKSSRPVPTCTWTTSGPTARTATSPARCG